MVFIHDFLRRNTLLSCFDGNGDPVFIRSPDEDHIFVVHSQETHVNIGGHIDSGQVSDMKRSVGVRECRGDRIALVTLFSCFHNCSLGRGAKIRIIGIRLFLYL